MIDLTYTVGAFDAETSTVAVTFAKGGIEHTRSVNAVVNFAGEFDEEATHARVSEVALGVDRKFDLGLLNPPPPPPEPETEPDGAE